MRLDKYPREFHRLMAQSALTKPGGEPFLLCSPRHHLSSDQPLALSGGRESEQHRVRSARATSPYEHSSRRRDGERNFSLFATVLVCVATLGEGQAFELLTSGSAIQSFLGSRNHPTSAERQLEGIEKVASAAHTSTSFVPAV